MKHFTSLAFVVLLTCSLPAQTLDEYKKQQQAEMQKFQQTQTEKKEQLRKEYADYVRKRDAEWADYLRKEWEMFSVFSGKKAPLKPKPNVVPAYVPPTSTPAPTNIPPIIPPKVTPVTVPKPDTQPTKPICKPAEDETNVNKVSIDFYGRTFSIPYDVAMGSCTLPDVSQNAISTFWEKASACNYTPVVERLLKAKSELQINDYGYFELVQQFSNGLFSTKENSARLMTWFILVRSGYGVRVAFKNQQIALLVPVQQQIYAKSYMTVGSKQFYLFPDINGGSFFTYDKDYSASARILDINIIHSLNFAGRKAEKVLSFNFDHQTYNLRVAYDPYLIDFFKTYPQTDLSVFFNAVTSNLAKQSLVEALKPYTSQMNELKAANFLLHFVQTAFQYKTDDEQFGREKFFFAEELFYYPYSDCEDRAVLFSYLVREILGLKVVGLNYPNHVATAIAFNSEVNGDYLMYNNIKYIVSDPTFINAPVGQSMPQFKNVSPKVIDVE